MSDDIIQELVAEIDGVEVVESAGQHVARVPPATWFDFHRAAKEAGFEMCVDITVVDWMRERPDRFEVVSNLLSMQHRLRLRAGTSLPAADPTLASLVPLWAGANFLEREAFDMFGVTFEGHPDLTRILMPDDWEGYPLRKDYGLGSVPVQFKAAHQVH